MVAPRAIFVRDNLWIFGTVLGIASMVAVLASVAWAQTSTNIHVMSDHVLPSVVGGVGIYASAVGTHEVNWRRKFDTRDDDEVEEEDDDDEVEEEEEKEGEN